MGLTTGAAAIQATSPTPQSPARAAKLVAILTFSTLVSGCSLTVRPLDQPSSPAPTRGAVATSAPDAAGDPPSGPVDSDSPGTLPIGGDVADAVALEPDPEQDATGVLDVAPEERITESPLDELASVDPESRPDNLDQSRDLVTAKVPTFDIPIEVNDRVLTWIDIYSGSMKSSFEAGLHRSGRYMEMFRRIFRDEGIPEDLVYMAAVESGYKTSAYSRAHAKGIFQFIAATARRYGLRVDYWVDERSDPEKSARAAARYMRDLYDEFGDWYLALAAYNAGEGKIRRALARTGARTFWEIARTRHIRRETKNHVPAILAATLISKEPGKYGLRANPDAPFQYDTVSVEGAVDLRVLARCAGTDVETMRRLNPALRRMQTPSDGRSDVRVPLGAGPATLAALERVPPNERVLYALHRVRRGDTLSEIASRYGVGVRAIQETNGLGRSTLIRVNQTLRIPSSAASRYAANGMPATDRQEGDVVVYRVRRGDTLSAIARRYGTTSETIAAVNGVSAGALLQIGQRLSVVPGVRTASVAQRIVSGGDSAAAGDGQRLVHTVRRGDTLSGIARRYGTTSTTIAAVNGISTRTLLQIGQRLSVVPGVRTPAVAQRIVSSGARAAGGDGQERLLYTVRRGDTLWRIASLYGTSVKALCALNRITPSTILHPGAQLTVGFR